jgi:hypothetical protein
MANIRHAFGILKSKGLLAVPSPYPDGLGITDVRDGVANSAEAVAERLGELLRRERRNGVENPIARPVVVVDEQAEVVVGHGIQLMRPVDSAVSVCILSPYHGAIHLDLSMR